MPANGGRILQMRRYDPLASALVPLGNTGVTPPAVTPTVVDIDAEIQFYGSFIEINEQVTLQAQDPKKYGVIKLSLIDLEAEVAIS